MIRPLSWNELIHKADLAITLSVSKTNISRVAQTTPVLLLLFANNAPSQETELIPAIVTDRPDVTESSIVVPKCSLQFENGITWTTDHGNQTANFSETLFVEYAGDFAKKGSSKQITHFGTAYRITPKQQVDFHFGFGVAHAPPEHFFAVGYSIRLDGIPAQ